MDSWRYSAVPLQFLGKTQVFRVFFLCIYNIYVGVGIYIYTLPETNIASDNRPSQKESRFQPLIFRGYDSFREGNHLDTYIYIYIHIVVHDFQFQFLQWKWTIANFGGRGRRESDLLQGE